MNRSIITALLSIGVLSGCRPDRIVSFVNVEDLPQVRLETAGEWPVDCQDYYLALASCGDYYIGTYYKDSLFFGILDAGFRTLHRMARRGRGPDEYIAPVLSGQSRPIDSSRLSFSLLERPKGLFQDLVTDCLSCGEQVVNSRQMPAEMQDMRMLFRAPGGGFFGVMDDLNQRVFTCDAAFSHITWHDRITVKRSYPEQDKDLQALGCISPDSLYVAFAYLNQPRIDLWKSDGQAIRTLVLPDMTGEVIDITCNSHSFFVLYEYPDNKPGRLLHLDWTGDKMDCSDLLSVSAVCAKNDSLITIRHTDGGVVFAKYVFCPASEKYRDRRE